MGLGGEASRKVMGRVTQARNLSALGFNIPWTAVTQPASMVNTLAKTMTSARGAIGWFNPAMRKRIEALPLSIGAS